MEFEDGERIVIIHFGELWLRGRNRGVYIRKLAGNIGEIMKGEDVRLEKQYDRFILRLGKRSNTERIKGKLGHVFGISNYEIAYATKSEMKSIIKMSKKVLDEMEKGMIKITAHRSYKGTDFDSMEIMAKVADVAKKMGFGLSNRGFSEELRINVTKDASFISRERVKTPGGLPVGTSGRGVVLLSGGIDSPVAAWYAMKRGVEPVYIHIHGYPDSKEVLKSKMPKILNFLSEYAPGGRVYYVPSHIFQLAGLKAGRYELILLKTFMLGVAEKIAEKEAAGLIFTGESLGQVASQTPSNLAAESYGIELPILRPLIGMDKEEIIRKAREIGTYELSIIGYKDVCSINSKNPKTQTPIGKIKELKKETKLAGIINRSVKAAEVFEVPA